MYVESRSLTKDLKVYISLSICFDLKLVQMTINQGLLPITITKYGYYKNYKKFDTAQTLTYY